jgi:hypothetical protein
MNKLKRAESLVKCNGVCMIAEKPGETICAGCPKKIKQFCKTLDENERPDYIKRATLAQKYIDKKTTLTPVEIDSVIRDDVKEKGTIFQTLMALAAEQRSKRGKKTTLGELPAGARVALRVDGKLRMFIRTADPVSKHNECIVVDLVTGEVAIYPGDTVVQK